MTEHKTQPESAEAAGINVDIFKASGGGHVTAGLFVEISKGEYNVYTVHTKDRDGLISIHQRYVEAEDLSEYNFANTWFYDYQHWVQVRESKQFVHFYEKMRDELQTKIVSMSLQRMLKNVRDSTATHQTLAFLANRGYIAKDKVGRPNKKATEKKAQAAVEAKAKEQEDLEALIAHDPKLKKLYR